MKTFTVREVRERAGELVRNAEQGRLALITKRGQPLLVAVPFDDDLLSQGLQISLAVHLFDEGVLRQGEAAKLAGLSLAEFFAACAERQVSVVRYPTRELHEELRSLTGRRDA